MRNPSKQLAGLPIRLDRRLKNVRTESRLRRVRRKLSLPTGGIVAVCVSISLEIGTVLAAIEERCRIRAPIPKMTPVAAALVYSHSHLLKLYR